MGYESLESKVVNTLNRIRVHVHDEHSEEGVFFYEYDHIKKQYFIITSMEATKVARMAEAQLHREYDTFGRMTCELKFYSSDGSEEYNVKMFRITRFW